MWLRPLSLYLSSVCEKWCLGAVCFAVQYERCRAITGTRYRSLAPWDYREGVKSPQTNRIVERLHKTMLTKFYRIRFRKKLSVNLAELQTDLDEWLRYYNEERVH